jgi:hypothetical protein
MPSRQTHEGVDAMGRGRAKAKQTKVARELKYFSPDTDLSALERELHGSSYREPEPVSEAPEDDEGYDDYGKWASGQR